MSSPNRSCGSASRSRPHTEVLTRPLPELLTVVDLSSGRHLWSHRTGHLADQTAAVATAGETVAELTSTGTVRAFDARTGQPRWTSPGLGAAIIGCRSFSGTLLAGEGQLLMSARCGADPPVLSSLSPSTGYVDWSFTAGPVGPGAPESQPNLTVRAIAPGTVLASMSTFDAVDQLPDPVRRMLRPAAGPGEPAGGQYLLAVDSRTGRLRWAAPAPGHETTTGAGTVCQVSEQQSYECRDLVTAAVTLPPTAPSVQHNPFGDANSGPLGEPRSAQLDDRLYRVAGDSRTGLRLETLNTRSGRSVSSIPLDIPSGSPPSTNVETTAVAAAPGLVLLRRADIEPFPLVANAD